MNVHSFNPESALVILQFLSTLRLVCDTNEIHKEWAKWKLLHYLDETIANALNVCLWIENRLNS